MGPEPFAQTPTVLSKLASAPTPANIDALLAAAKQAQALPMPTVPAKVVIPIGNPGITGMNYSLSSPNLIFAPAPAPGPQGEPVHIAECHIGSLLLMQQAGHVLSPPPTKVLETIGVLQERWH